MLPTLVLLGSLCAQTMQGSLPLRSGFPISNDKLRYLRNVRHVNSNQVSTTLEASVQSDKAAAENGENPEVPDTKEKIEKTLEDEENTFLRKLTSARSQKKNKKIAKPKKSKGINKEENREEDHPSKTRSKRSADSILLLDDSRTADHIDGLARLANDLQRTNSLGPLEIGPYESFVLPEDDEVQPQFAYQTYNKRSDYDPRYWYQQPDYFGEENSIRNEPMAYDFVGPLGEATDYDFLPKYDVGSLERPSVDDSVLIDGVPVEFEVVDPDYGAEDLNRLQSKRALANDFRLANEYIQNSLFNDMPVDPNTYDEQPQIWNDEEAVEILPAVAYIDDVPESNFDDGDTVIIPLDLNGGEEDDDNFSFDDIQNVVDDSRPIMVLDDDVDDDDLDDGYSIGRVDKRGGNGGWVDDSYLVLTMPEEDIQVVPLYINDGDNYINDDEDEDGYDNGDMEFISGPIIVEASPDGDDIERIESEPIVLIEDQSDQDVIPLEAMESIDRDRRSSLLPGLRYNNFYRGNYNGFLNSFYGRYGRSLNKRSLLDEEQENDENEEIVAPVIVMEIDDDDDDDVDADNDAGEELLEPILEEAIAEVPAETIELVELIEPEELEGVAVELPNEDTFDSNEIDKRSFDESDADLELQSRIADLIQQL